MRVFEDDVERDVLRLRGGRRRRRDVDGDGLAGTQVGAQALSPSLTAALGVQSAELGDLFSGGASRAWSFAPQIVAPIFSGGRIRAGVQVAKAREQAALAVYGQAIQNAFREVDDAIVSITKLREQLAADEANAQAEARRLELSQLRYDAGIASYSDVLDAQRFLFSSELNAVQTRNDLLSAIAQLYKALGGGWALADTQSPSAAAKP